MNVSLSTFVSRAVFSLLRPQMRFYVRLEAVGRGKRPRAVRFGAGVGSFAAVGPLVGFEVVAGRERLSTTVFFASETIQWVQGKIGDLATIHESFFVIKGKIRCRF